MTYNPRVANISREEFDTLMAIARGEDRAEPILSAEDVWRRDYAEEQRQKRIVGYQQDLFGRDTITHYHRHAPPPQVDRPPVETVEAKLERIKGDPFATFGPPRPDRPGMLTADERARTVAGAANWLRVGQRVRLADAPGSVDPAFGIQRFLGRAGVVWRLCTGTFADHCYVFFDPVGGERTAKIEFVELRDLEPLT